MALSMKAALEAIATVLRAIEVEGTDVVARVFTASDDGAQAVPAAINEFPSVVLLPGPDAGPYILNGRSHRHTYDVRCLVFMRAGSDTGQSWYQGIDLVDKVIEAFVGEQGLGGTVNSCKYERQSGYVVLEWGGIEYDGIEITLRVSEQASATPAN